MGGKRVGRGLPCDSWPRPSLTAPLPPSLAQGLGWPAIARLLTVWFAPAERGTYWALASTSQNVGAALAPLAVAAALPRGWAAGLLAPAGVGLAAAAMPLLLTPRRGPSGAASPPREPLWPQLRSRVLPNVRFWCVCCANLCGIFGRSAVRSWLGVYASEQAVLPDAAASALVTTFEMGGVLGSLAAGPASDRLASGRRAPVLALYMLLAAAGVASLSASLPPAPPAPETSAPPPAAPLCAAAIGCGAYGALTLIGLLAIEVSHPRTAGLATAVHGAVGQFGYVLSGYPLSRAIETGGWPAFSAACVTAFLAGAAALLASSRAGTARGGGARQKVD